MSETTNIKKTLESWAVPSPQDDALWETMTREEQLEACRLHFASAECSRPTDASIAEIAERTRSRRKSKADGQDL